jgi:hypothetical protein
MAEPFGSIGEKIKIGNPDAADILWLFVLHDKGLGQQP